MAPNQVRLLLLISAVLATGSARAVPEKAFDVHFSSHATGFDIDQAAIRMIDTASEVHLHDFGLGPPTPTMSFRVPDGVLLPGVENGFSPFSTPEPGFLTALLLALASIAAARAIRATERSGGRRSRRARPR